VDKQVSLSGSQAWSLCLLLILSLTLRASAQDTVTGAFEGLVTASLTGQALNGVTVEIINQEKGVKITTRTDSRGRFYHGLLTPGLYTIRVSLAGYQPRELAQRLEISRTGEVIPIPVALDPVGTTLTAPSAPFNPTPASNDVRATVNTTDARRNRGFPEEEVTGLPLGSTTISRTFDQLTLLAPGVALPPQTLGSVAGPGIGAGVGTAGQFAVNGLRSRANNFTVDGSDNNDEDIGVRRQGFIALIPQTIESIKEYHAITLLAPAQFGRNLGAQVNAVSKSGGSSVHGVLYGFLNTSQVNARNAFDTINERLITSDVRRQDLFAESARNDLVMLMTEDQRRVLLNGRPIRVRRQSGSEDSLTLGKFGGTLGGPIRRERVFYFLSGEGQLVNARQEASFAVPTVSQRGAFRTGATGVFADPLESPQNSACGSGDCRAVPSRPEGDAVFSLFPFPNNPQGVYGANTFTRDLPASGRGVIWSAKVDHNFAIRGRPQSVTERYNFTQDRRDIPVTGQALFSSLRPQVRTQNFSFFYNSQVSVPESVNAVFNQLRFSYGRTRLRFDEIRDREFLRPTRNFESVPFLLNTDEICNRTWPTAPGVPNTGDVIYSTRCNPVTGLITSAEELGPVGQIVVAGFSPLGVDVYNFPQKRVNNTYQLADNLTRRSGNHNLTAGADFRRTELNSDLPRLARPLITYYGGPRLTGENNDYRLLPETAPNRIIRPEDLVALGAPSGFFLTLNYQRDDANINLRFYQSNFFGQDEWRIRRNLSLVYGLRYEYNSPPKEVNGLIEKTFANPQLDQLERGFPDDPATNPIKGLKFFLAGRRRIFEPDRNNFAPRISAAWSPSFFGRDRITVIRAGYGLFYDQIIGAAVSQSRNVFPSFLSLNFGGAERPGRSERLTIFNPSLTIIANNPVVQDGTLNRLDPNTPLDEFISDLQRLYPSALGFTLPERKLVTPLAHHYTFSIEQQFGARLAVSAAYVGTKGSDLLRFATPNLGPGVTLVANEFDVVSLGFRSDPQIYFPQIIGTSRIPARPVGSLGSVSIFETTAGSRYDSLQVSARGQIRDSLRFQTAYTLSRAIDDVSDVFDLAGASALPQNSLTLTGERGAAGFDALHRLNFSFAWDFSGFSLSRGKTGWLFDGLQALGTGRFQTGQPFTVNSAFDVNLDGNLTDRLNNLSGLEVTGRSAQPLRLTTSDPLSLLAPFGADGRVERNRFRAGKFFETDLTLLKSIVLGPGRRLLLRVEIFNLFNRASFGIPERLLETPWFGRATNTVTPARRIQFSVKYQF
jgi:hypothetical protein